MGRVIETERLVLRPWKVDDIAEARSLFRYASDSEIGQLCGWPPHRSIEDSLDVIRTVLAASGSWAITVKSNGDNAVGSIALKPISRHIVDTVKSDAGLRSRYGKYLGDNALEVGYWIGRPFWGNGYMTEAVSATLGHALDTLHKDAVWGAHYADNVQSCCVMAKCGMGPAFESKRVYLNLTGEYHDFIIRIICPLQGSVNQPCADYRQ